MPANVELAVSHHFRGLYHKIECMDSSSVPLSPSLEAAYADLQAENGRLKAQLVAQEQRTSQTAQRTHLILQAALEGFHIVGPDTRILDCNESFARIVGYTREALLQMRITEIDKRPPEELGRVIENIIKKGAARFYAQHMHREGHLIDVEVSAHHVKLDNEEFFAAFSHPITEQLQREAALRESEQKFRAIFDKSSMLIGLLSPSGVLLESNQGLAAILGKDQQSANGKAGTLRFWEGSCWRQDRIRAHVRKCVEEAAAGRQAVCEVELLRDDSTSCLIELTIKPSRDQSGHNVLLLAEGYDVTSLRRTEAERASLQAQMIQAQEATIRELSIPMIPVDAGVVVVPLIGRFDKGRSAQLLEKLLEGVASQSASIVILDVTGITRVDGDVANSLIRATQAVKLLGAQVILTGVRPEMAQSMVSQGIDLSQLVTLGSLQAGLIHAANHFVPSTLSRDKRAAPRDERLHRLYR